MIFKRLRGVSEYGQEGTVEQYREDKKMLNQRRWQYFLIYTLLFAAAALLVFSWSFLSGRTLINTGDAWHQHYRALVYYSTYLKSIVKELLFQHKIVIPAWDFAIGEGSDILRTMHYYVIGDPFQLFSVFVPTRFLYIYYDAMIILRMYLAGIAFSCLCFQTGQKNRNAVLAGSLAYAFSYWAIKGAMHHFFLTPMIYLPLLILGVEKIWKKERSYLFIITVFFSAVSNIYFFYMLVLLTIVYVMVRMIVSFRTDFKLALQMFCRIGAASVLGVLLAAVILLPVIPAFMESSRMSVENAIHLFYPGSYYMQYPASLITWGKAPSWLCLGFVVPVLPAVFLLFYKRGEQKLKILKIFFLMCLVMSAFPVFGHILNGFSYKVNRWSFAFALVAAYILTAAWPSLMKLQKNEKKFLLCTLSGYVIVCMALEYLQRWLENGAAAWDIRSSLILLVLFLGLLFLGGKENGIWGQMKSWAALLIVLLSIFNNNYWHNMTTEGNVNAAHNHVEKAAVAGLTSNEASAVQQVADLDGVLEFYRFSGDSLIPNAGVNSGIPSTQFYWSLSNPNVMELRKETQLMESRSQEYTGYDGRTGQTALASVRYYVVPANVQAPVPYGFTYVDHGIDGRYCVYRNDNALPLSYTYDSCMLEDDWKELSAVEKQEAMLKTCVLAEEENVTRQAPRLTAKDIDYKLICKGDGIQKKGNTLVVTSTKAAVKLKFSGLKNSETYVSVCGLSFEGEEDLMKGKPTSAPITVKSSTGITRILEYDTEENNFYNNRHDFTINLGYSEEAAKSVTIKFKKTGTYSFDSLQVQCQPMEDYQEQIKARKEDTLQNMKVDINTVTGNISLDKSKLLCLSIPYASGWRAYVDGEEREILRANIQYMAIALDAGTHDVKLVYATPLQKAGIGVSVAAFLVFVILIGSVFGCIFLKFRIK